MNLLPRYVCSSVSADCTPAEKEGCSFFRSAALSQIKRWLLLCIGLWIMALGVAFSINAGLGTSPISSVPYTVNLFTPLSVGTVSIIMHVLFILLQIVILRRRYQPFQLLQLPVALLFGYLTDLAIFLLSNISCSTYLQQWLCCIVGILLVGIGVSLEVTAKTVTLAGEGLILAICQVLPIKFGTMKVLFDVTLVSTAIILSLLFLGNVAGVREGTIAAALLVGTIARQINWLLQRTPLGKL
jgi:uncharacterized membrane protein YczE